MDYHTVEEVIKLGCKVLKDDSLREAFRHFALEDSHSSAIPWDRQEAFLHPVSESDTFDRDLRAASASFPFLNPKSDQTIDLTTESASAFSCSLNPGVQAIDLD